jgi:hypothetical protein
VTLKNSWQCLITWLLGRKLKLSKLTLEDKVIILTKKVNKLQYQTSMNFKYIKLLLSKVEGLEQDKNVS